MNDYITLSDYEIDFLQYKLKIQNPDEIIEKVVELMVKDGLNPMDLKEYVQTLMKRYQC